ncbi:uncharacterized protein EV420DRAFT_1123740 [Desarmillaria tabescens]|uniref:Uncharacterized protein n=1 Tax=Armillaria tabescens TaxID=1929756 RepID=A0AA39JFR9_ARMTA|nr:uncharacterized protein EV420DRAFT_1123740 [Desarmillaria tabescens]KAK0441150.1 hypothetical protein EV420DRAFT_1123740 [Desarmillaria tabescens]
MFSDISQSFSLALFCFFYQLYYFWAAADPYCRVWMLPAWKVTERNYCMIKAILVLVLERLRTCYQLWRLAQESISIRRMALNLFSKSLI